MSNLDQSVDVDCAPDSTDIDAGAQPGYKIEKVPPQPKNPAVAVGDLHKSLGIRTKKNTNVQKLPATGPEPTISSSASSNNSSNSQ